MILLMGRWLQKICRASAWLLALAIVVLSLVPPSYRPITEASHNIEHLAIFLTTGFAFCVAYPDRPFALATGLVIFCGAIELPAVGSRASCTAQRFHRGCRSSLYRTQCDIRRHKIQWIQHKVVGECMGIGGTESKHEHLPGRQAGTVDAFLILLSAGGR
jgi:hypothetical protein